MPETRAEGGIRTPHHALDDGAGSAPAPAPGAARRAHRRTAQHQRQHHGAVPQHRRATSHHLVRRPSPPPLLPFSSTITPPQSITPSSPGPADAGEYFNPRVLLVDDNAINLKLLVVFAKRQSLRYTEAVNGLEAFETYKTEALSSSPPTRPFDFILMDISMPVMDGLSSTRAIRKFERENGLQRAHIVALTGLASEKDQTDAQEAGVDMYLVKPVKFADIRRVFGTR